MYCYIYMVCKIFLSGRKYTIRMPPGAFCNTIWSLEGIHTINFGHYKSSLSADSLNCTFEYTAPRSPLKAPAPVPSPPFHHPLLWGLPQPTDKQTGTTNNSISPFWCYSEADTDLPAMGVIAPAKVLWPSSPLPSL